MTTDSVPPVSLHPETCPFVRGGPCSCTAPPPVVFEHGHYNFVTSDRKARRIDSTEHFTVKIVMPGIVASAVGLIIALNWKRWKRRCPGCGRKHGKRDGTDAWMAHIATCKAEQRRSQE